MHAKRRIETLPDKLRKHPGYFAHDSIAVLLCGDLIEGEDIFATQNIGLTEPAIAQVDVATSALAAMIDELRSDGVPISVHTVPGNHGRMSKSASPESNWDNALYSRLCSLVHDGRRVHAMANYRDMLTVTIAGRRVLLWHYCAKHLGTPAMQARFLGQLADHRASIMCGGHWHRARLEAHRGMWLSGNGSLSGGDDLSATMGCSEPPRQVFFGLDREAGLFGWGTLQW